MQRGPRPNGHQESGVNHGTDRIVVIIPIKLRATVLEASIRLANPTGAKPEPRNPISGAIRRVPSSA